MTLSTTENTRRICRGTTEASRGKTSIMFSCASGNDVRTRHITTRTPFASDKQFELPLSFPIRSSRRRHVARKCERKNGRQKERRNSQSLAERRSTLNLVSGLKIFILAVSKQRSRDRIGPLERPESPRRESKCYILLNMDFKRVSAISPLPLLFVRQKREV